VHSYEARIKRADGTTVYALVSEAPRRRGDELVGWIQVITDLSESESMRRALEAAKDEAERANKAKSIFLANMSHELRTPLNAIIGYAELVIEERPEDIEITSDVGHIHNAAIHLLELINNILDLSKIEAGRMEIVNNWFAVDEFSEQLMTTVRPLAERNNNILDLRYDATLTRCYSDRLKLRQILLNLLSNACKFTRDGVVGLEVSRELNADREELVFAVTDSGIGMTPAQQRSIFKPFAQAERDTAQKYGGTGLGLTISKHFVELLDGSMAVESAPDEGSTFLVRVPRERRG
jgi:signal transduction histidine kinase